jgi:hypothetical protein
MFAVHPFAAYLPLHEDDCTRKRYPHSDQEA